MYVKVACGEIIVPASYRQTRVKFSLHSCRYSTTPRARELHIHVLRVWSATRLVPGVHINGNWRRTQ